MTRKRELGTENENITKTVFSFYDVPSHVKDMDDTANALGFKSRSEFIRWAVDPHVVKFKGGEVKKSSFNLEAKTAEKLKLQKKEEQLAELLKNSKVGNDTAFSVMRKFAILQGTDVKLVKDFAKVLEKIKIYEFTGREQFNKDHLITFILYGQAVLARRAIVEEFDAYFRSESAGGQELPLGIKVLEA